MFKITVRGCPVCGGESASVAHTQEFVVPGGTVAPFVVDVVICERCGMCFSDLEMSQAEIDVSYAEHSKYADVSLYRDGDDTPPIDAPWDLERLAGTARWLADRVPTDARILDAGCATGALVSYLQHEGFTKIVGLDPSPAAVATVGRHYGIRAIAGSLLDPPEDLGTFDLVILSHVMEHVRDVRSAVEGLHRMTNVGGLVYVEVPDAARYVDHLVAPFHDFNTEHINHFSEPLLRGLFESAGFRTRSSGFKSVLASPTDPYSAAFGLFEKVSAELHWRSVDADPGLRPAIGRYVDRSTELMDSYARAVHEQVGTGPVVVWGAGQLSMKLLVGPLSDIEIEAIVDGSADKWGLRMGDTEIVSPDSIEASMTPILVTSVHHFASIASDIEQRYPGRRIFALPAAPADLS